MGFRGDIYEEANITITQTKRDKYVTKLDNASITTDLIPAGGGNISSGTLTFRKTYNTGETENASENVTFSTVSATTKGTTESPVTDVKTIPAGGTTQKQTTIDGITLTHPSFTVKQAANTKTIKTPESKTTTSVILSVNPTVVYSSGGTVTFTLQRKYTLNKVVYQYTSGGGSDANQGPEAVNANQTYTITGITNVSSTTGTSYKIPSSDTARTIKFKTTYDGITSNEASVSQKLDGPNESKAFIYSNLKITEYSYTKDKSGYHFPASGKTITATDCTLKGTYDWTYTSMENKTVKETVTWTFNDLTAAMYTFTPTSFTADSSSPSKTATTSTIYKFKGWSLTTNGNVVTFPYTLTTTSSTFNFYAIYTSSTNTCTINWNNTNSNIAIWSDNTKGTKTSSANYGTKYNELTAPATLANPIKNDNDTIRYTGAWYTASINGTLLSNSSATVTSNPTNVYLQLTIAGYKVTLNPNNGTLTVSGHAYTSLNPYITYTKGSFNLGSFVPTYTNYNFKGWSTNSSATTGSTSSVTINTAITYYAIWKQIFTVTWNLNGGNIGGVTTNKTESVESGSTVSFTKYTPVKTGYTFNGWATSSTATSGSTTGNSAAITADTTFYATWKSAKLTPILLILAE